MNCNCSPLFGNPSIRNPLVRYGSCVQYLLINSCIVVSGSEVPLRRYSIISFSRSLKSSRSIPGEMDFSGGIKGSGLVLSVLRGSPPSNLNDKKQLIKRIAHISMAIGLQLSKKSHWSTDYKISDAKIFTWFHVFRMCKITAVWMMHLILIWKLLMPEV